MAEFDAASQGKIILADTHCHLDFNVYNDDRSEVLMAAEQAGLKYIINPAVDLASSRSIVSMARDHYEVFAGVGVHPNDALSWDVESYNQLQELSRNDKVVAIGEIGLDYYRDRTPIDWQRKVFQSQLNLAKEVELPVIIHTRQSFPDVLAILKEWKDELKLIGSGLCNRPGVLHSFSGNLQEAWRALELDFWIGITGPVTFKNSAELQIVVTELPLEKLLVETDSPFLTPHPMRGQRNQPAYVYHVAQKIAELKAVPVELVGKVTTANAEKLFFGESLVG